MMCTPATPNSWVESADPNTPPQWGVHNLGLLFDVLTALGVGLRYGERSAPDGAGELPFRIDPTIISTDIESVLLDKDRGAQRAFEYFATRGPLPRRWRSIGDAIHDSAGAEFVAHWRKELGLD